MWPWGALSAAFNSVLTAEIFQTLQVSQPSCSGSHDESEKIMKTHVTSLFWNVQTFRCQTGAPEPSICYGGSCSFSDIDHQDRTVIILSFTPGWCSQLNFASESIRSSVRGRPRRIFIGQCQYLECTAADCCFNVSIRHKILNLNEPLFKIPKTYFSSSL